MAISTPRTRCSSRASRSRASSVSDPRSPKSLSILASLARDRRDYAAAREHFAEALSTLLELGDRRNVIGAVPPEGFKAKFDGQMMEARGASGDGAADGRTGARCRKQAIPLVLAEGSGSPADVEGVAQRPLPRSGTV